MARIEIKNKKKGSTKCINSILKAHRIKIFINNSNFKSRTKIHSFYKNLEIKKVTKNPIIPEIFKLLITL